MKPSLKKTLMTLTMLSAGFFICSPYAAQAAFKKPKVKEVASDTSFQQYPKLGEVKADVNAALELHQTATFLLSDKKTLEDYKASIEKYDEIVKRLNQNIQCNKTQLNEYFSNGDQVWKNASAWAEDSATRLLANASDSLGDSATAATGTSASDTDSAYAGINESTSEAEAMAMAKSGGADAQAIGDAALESDEMDMDELTAFGKIRWDVGYEVLKDIYANPEKWGDQKKKFTPWVDQKHVYDVYLKNHYADMEKHYVATPLKPFPAKPTMNSGASYLPADYYDGTVPEMKVSDTPYVAASASADDVWCGQTGDKKNECARVNKGALYSKHLAYVAALQTYPLKQGYSAPSMEAPYLPQAPLPPWRESVFILNVNKELPQVASNLPDPWYKVTQNIENFTSQGELANLVERHGNTIRYRPGDYNNETKEIKNDSNGTPKLPIPLIENRISSYLALVTAKDEQEPIKDRAVASIQELNESIIAVLAKAGYDVPNKDTFSLANESDYQMAMNKLEELQNQKATSAETKMATLRAEFGGSLLPSVKQILDEESVTLNALKKDSEFLVGVTRDNASEINSLLMTAVADATANQTYKENLEKQMEDTTPLPPVGCPVL